MDRHGCTRGRRRRWAQAVARGRFLDYPRQGRRGLRRWIPSWRQLLSAFLLGTACLAGLCGYVYTHVGIPDENAVARQEANTYYWADGTQMVSLGAVNRNSVQLSDVPKSVQNAVIAAENESFYSDSGVSPTGILRAALSAVRGQETQGGSTITQQYVKNTYLSQEQTASRKVKEFVIALKLDRTKSKSEILQGYLNTSWFGRGAYGIEAAAQAYYGIPARKLDPSQGALLASLLKGAEQYDPAISGGNHERARERWKWILDREVKAGLISPSERAKHREFPEPHKQSTATSLGGQTGYLVDVANKYIKQNSKLTDRDLAHGGYRIHTTFDKKRMGKLEKAVNGVLKKNIDPKKRPADRGVEVGAASVRPSDGAVLALYGGPDATRHFVNNADTSGVPVGSAFKPFVLAAALQYGAQAQPGSGGARQNVAADSYYAEDGSLRSASAVGPFAPADGRPMDQTFPGRPDLLIGAGPDASHPTLSQALSQGGNATYTRLGREVGLEEVRDTAVRSGLLKDSMAELESTFPIGTSTPSTIRMATAYTTFVNHGLRHDPYSVTKVLKDGVRVKGFVDRAMAQRAMDAQVADEVLGALNEAGSEAGESMDPNIATRSAPFAAGRTVDQDRLRAAWFVASTDTLSTAITLFRTTPDTPQLLPLSGVAGRNSQHGNTLPPRIWADYATGEGS
ncbi:transglycosylase domain-containing protein [Streptomyces pathocidini]|uniref:transglycosylase domain-containing protein n=1 Tax=Streptomyces pathocidini TaxID=1650571 RepID=UPI0033E082C7